MLRKRFTFICVLSYEHQNVYSWLVGNFIIEFLDRLGTQAWRYIIKDSNQMMLQNSSRRYSPVDTAACGCCRLLDALWTITVHWKPLPLHHLLQRMVSSIHWSPLTEISHGYTLLAESKANVYNIAARKCGKVSIWLLGWENKSPTMETLTLTQVFKHFEWPQIMTCVCWSLFKSTMK